MMPLLQTSWKVCQWNNSENQPISNEVRRKTLASFLIHCRLSSYFFMLLPLFIGAIIHSRRQSKIIKYQILDNIGVTNLTKTSALKTQPIMLPRCGTLLTYGSALVTSRLRSPAIGNLNHITITTVTVFNLLNEENTAVRKDSIHFSDLTCS